MRFFSSPAGLQLVVGLALAIGSVVVVAHADSGPGGSCHTDVYYSTDDVFNQNWGRRYAVCKQLTCPLPCPNGGTDIGGGWTTCLCDGDTTTCNAGYRDDGGQGAPATACYNPTNCPAGQFCKSGTYDADDPTYGPQGQGGYEKKFVCWCNNTP